MHWTTAHSSKRLFHPQCIHGGISFYTVHIANMNMARNVRCFNNNMHIKQTIPSINRMASGVLRSGYLKEERKKRDGGGGGGA